MAGPVQMKSRAESLDSDLDLLRAAFSEISRLAAEVSAEPEVKTRLQSSSDRVASREV
jgi:hypothetical protein